MYAFTHGQETDCSAFQAAGSAYCGDCYRAEATMSHLKTEPCSQACRRRSDQILREIGERARRLSKQLDRRDLHEQNDLLATLRRVQCRLEEVEKFSRA